MFLNQCFQSVLDGLDQARESDGGVERSTCEHGVLEVHAMRDRKGTLALLDEKTRKPKKESRTWFYNESASGNDLSTAVAAVSTRSLTLPLFLSLFSHDDAVWVREV